jgi:peptidoglycan hydrolase-like protein with peptidoglycan-binding domain
MKRITLPICLIAALVLSAAVKADELTQIIQKDLVALGYDPGNIQGEMTTDTIVAISKFQAENNLEVTGEASPQLAGVIKAKLKEQSNPGAGSASAPAVAAAQKTSPQPMDEAALQKAQQACLQEKIAAAQASQKKKRGLGSLMRAVTNTAARYGGNSGLARQVRETSYDIYRADATADDWNRAAEDLGLTSDDLEACRNPQM